METVLVLRERIRSHRAEVRYQQVLSANPDAQTPEGLQRTTCAELAQESSRRGIEIPAGSSNRAQATRAQMVILIQDHVKAAQENLDAVEGCQMEEDLADL